MRFLLGQMSMTDDDTWGLGCIHVLNIEEVAWTLSLPNYMSF